MAVPAAHMRETAARISSMIRPRHDPGLGGQGHRARQPRPHEPGAVRGAGHRSEPRLRPVRTQPGRRDRGRAARERGRRRSVDGAVGARVVELLGSRSFRLYRNRDLVGVELAGALKNIVAIAAGAADALGLGDNGKAAIVTRGLAEITRLGVAAGANPLTFAGLAGIGDILATCASPLSRNHRLGMELAGGRRLGGHRGIAARGRRGCLHGRGGAGPCRAAGCRRCPSRARSTPCCTRASPSRTRCATCSPATRRTSWQGCPRRRLTRTSSCRGKSRDSGAADQWDDAQIGKGPRPRSSTPLEMADTDHVLLSLGPLLVMTMSVRSLAAVPCRSLHRGPPSARAAHRHGREPTVSALQARRLCGRSRRPRRRPGGRGCHRHPLPWALVALWPLHRCHRRHQAPARPVRRRRPWRRQRREPDGTSRAVVALGSVRPRGPRAGRRRPWHQAVRSAPISTSRPWGTGSPRRPPARSRPVRPRGPVSPVSPLAPVAPVKPRGPAPLRRRDQWHRLNPPAAPRGPVRPGITLGAPCNTGGASEPARTGIALGALWPGCAR